MNKLEIQEVKLQVRPLETIEGEINFYKQQTALGIIEIGKRLIEAKEQVSHGEWEKWLEEKVDFSKSTAKNFMRCATEFSNRQAIVDLGQTKIFALLSLPQDDRDEFMSTPHEVNGQTKTIEEMTSRELQQAIKEKKEAEKKALEAEKEKEDLKKQLEAEKSKPKEKEVITKTVEVDKTDYTLKTQLEAVEKLRLSLLEEYSNYKKKSEFEKNQLTSQLKIEKRKLEAEKTRNEFLEKAQKEYGDLQKSIETLTQEKGSISRAVSVGTELSGLAISIQGLIERELAPIKYSRALREASESEIVRENLSDIVDVVEDWCREMRTYIVNNNANENIVIIEGEVIE